jgi:hypothetical protein
MSAPDASAKENAAAWLASIALMISKLHDDTDDSAREEIESSALSVLVRDGWYVPGQRPDDGPEEFEILLSTGGPGLRVYGRLDEYRQPHSPELQIQDSFLPWTPYPASQALLLEFAGCFYFGA